MIHIQNIPHILQHGITHSNSPNANPHFVPIGDGSLIAHRNNFRLNNGRRLGEYIPFYFGVRTPMLYVVQKGLNKVAPTPAEEIVYCVSSVQKIIDLNLEFVFTDGHAVDGFSSQYTANAIEDIETILDMDAIKAKYWKDENDLDRKRRKEAEFLVLGDIAKEALLGLLPLTKMQKTLSPALVQIMPKCTLDPHTISKT
jgi:hypothetical protein